MTTIYVAQGLVHVFNRLPLIHDTLIEHTCTADMTT